MKVLLFIICFFGTASSMAQKNTRKGFIITKSNDTLRGWVSYRGRTIRRVSFATDVQDRNSVEYSPTDISGFSVLYEDSYVSATILKDTSPELYDDLRSCASVDLVRDTVFLKVLVKGNRLGLFELKDNIKVHYFIKFATANHYTELIHKYCLGDGDEFIVMNNFKEQLIDIAKERGASDKLLSMISACEYEEEDLKAIIIALN